MMKKFIFAAVLFLMGSSMISCTKDEVNPQAHPILADDQHPAKDNRTGRGGR